MNWEDVVGFKKKNGTPWTPEEVWQYWNPSKTELEYAKSKYKGEHFTKEDKQKNFAEYCISELQAISRFGVVPLVLFRYQRNLFRSISTNRLTVSRKGRQMGLDTLATAYHLWRAFKGDYKGLVMAETSLAVHNQHYQMLEAIKRNSDTSFFLQTANKEFIRFKNGSVIYFTSLRNNVGCSTNVDFTSVSDCSRESVCFSQPLFCNSKRIWLYSSCLDDAEGCVELEKLTETDHSPFYTENFYYENPLLMQEIESMLAIHPRFGSHYGRNYEKIKDFLKETP